MFGNIKQKEARPVINRVVKRFNTKPITKALKELLETIKAQDLSVSVESPTVNVEAPIVHIDTKDLTEKLDAVLMAISGLKIEAPVVNVKEQRIDVSEIVSKLTAVRAEIARNKALSAESLRVILKDALSFLYTSDPKKYLPVRLSNGKEFITSLTTAVGGGMKTVDKIAKDNSSITPLEANETFVGEPMDTLGYSTIALLVYSDVASATNGLVVQFSNDCTDWHNAETYTIPAGSTKFFTPPMQAAFARVSYTNGAVAQSEFHLHVTLKVNPIKWSSHNISDQITGNDDAQLVKAVITGLRDDGEFGNAILDNENRLQINAQSYLYGIAENAIVGHSSLLKFGTRTTVAANTQSLVWEGAAAAYTYLTSAEQLKVSSSSGNDTSNGTGFRTITLIGLDGNFNELSEVVIMNGVTAVTTVNNFLRIYRAYGTTSGTLLTNAGNITITNNAETTQLVYIPAGDGQTLMTMWTVPLNKVAYLTQLTASTNSNKGARISLYTRLNDGGILYPWQIKYRAYIFSGNEVFPFNIPFKIPAKTDIQVRVTTPTSAGDTSAGATFELWYEDVD